MRRILYCIVALLLVACGDGKKPDFAAANAAKDYYNLLLEGKADAFVDKMDMQDSIPEMYREQLVANIKMYMAQQQLEHRGIKKVEVQNCINDSLQPTAQALRWQVADEVRPFKDSLLFLSSLPLLLS